MGFFDSIFGGSDNEESSVSSSFSNAASDSLQRSRSAPLTPGQVGSYFSHLNKRTGGRLNRLAKIGTPAVNYHAPTNAQIRNLGGFGALRRRDLGRVRGEALGQINADPSLTTYQTQRSRQLTNQDYASGVDALNQEIEAMITQVAMDRADKQHEAGVGNAQRLRDDMALLSEIFYGGKGQLATSLGRQKSRATSSSSGTSSGSGSSTPGLAGLVDIGFKF